MREMVQAILSSPVPMAAYVAPVGSRAVVTEADGKRTASVTEGEKQASILKAGDEKQAAILRAEASRQSRMLGAGSYADALQRIFAVGQTLDSNTMGPQYLDTLKPIDNRPSTKYIFPMEFTHLMSSFRQMMNPTREQNGPQDPENGR